VWFSLQKALHGAVLNLGFAEVQIAFINSEELWIVVDSADLKPDDNDPPGESGIGTFRPSMSTSLVVLSI
jgi:hypothetical protein